MPCVNDFVIELHGQTKDAEPCLVRHTRHWQKISHFVSWSSDAEQSVFCEGQTDHCVARLEVTTAAWLKKWTKQVSQCLNETESDVPAEQPAVPEHYVNASFLFFCYCQWCTTHNNSLNFMTEGQNDWCLFRLGTTERPAFCVIIVQTAVDTDTVLPHP